MARFEHEVLRPVDEDGALGAPARPEQEGRAGRSAETAATASSASIDQPSRAWRAARPRFDRQGGVEQENTCRAHGVRSPVVTGAAPRSAAHSATIAFSDAGRRRVPRYENASPCASPGVG